jgi:hypothetical protein
VHDGLPIKVIHRLHDTVFKFLFGYDADVAQHGAGEFGKEAFDEVEPSSIPSFFINKIANLNITSREKSPGN